MYKITDSLLLEVKEVLARSDKAINVLQRAGNNKIIYPELQKDLQSLLEKLNSQYSLAEFVDPGARDKMLRRKQREAEKDWEGRKIG